MEEEIGETPTAFEGAGEEGAKVKKPRKQAVAKNPVTPKLARL